MTQDMAYATGAHPDYNPQMAESIEVFSNEPTIIDGNIHVPLLDRLAWTITWTDTDGGRHGRIWNYARDIVEALGLGDGAHGGAFPLAVASTQAGCVWVWKKGTEIWAEVQQAHGDHDRYPRIPIKSIFGRESELRMTWERVVMPMESPWTGADVADPEILIGEGR